MPGPKITHGTTPRIPTHSEPTTPAAPKETRTAKAKGPTQLHQRDHISHTEPSDKSSKAPESQLIPDAPTQGKTTSAESKSTGSPPAMPAGLDSAAALLDVPAKKAGPRLKVERKRMAKGSMQCRLLPRMRGKPVGIVRDQSTGLYSQGNTLPGFKAPRGAAKGPPEDDKLNQSLEKCSCMVHGIDAQWVGATLNNDALISGYALRGPSGKYSRDADRNGGGATGVYTRAVGTGQTKWSASGFGVGSSDARVQLVLSPEILAKPDHVWRASTTDGMGKLPGVTKKFMKEVVTERSGVDAFNAWEQQTEKDRNYQFKAVTEGNMMENNEQLHWEKVPLAQSLAAMVCTQSAIKTLEPLCKTNAAGQLVIPFAGREVPVIVASKGDGLLGKLKEHGVTNDKNQVRLGT